MHGRLPKNVVKLRFGFTSTCFDRVGRCYQDAWRYKYENGSPVDIYIDMDVARDIHAVFLRAARNMVLAAYDLNTTKALERNDKDRLRVHRKDKTVPSRFYE